MVTGELRRGRWVPVSLVDPTPLMDLRGSPWPWHLVAPLLLVDSDSSSDAHPRSVGIRGPLPTTPTILRAVKALQYVTEASTFFGFCLQFPQYPGGRVQPSEASVLGGSFLGAPFSLPLACSPHCEPEGTSGSRHCSLQLQRPLRPPSPSTRRRASASALPQLLPA